MKTDFSGLSQPLKDIQELAEVLLRDTCVLYYRQGFRKQG